MRKQELGVGLKPPDPVRKTWPRTPQRDDLLGYSVYGGGDNVNDQVETPDQ